MAFDPVTLAPQWKFRLPLSVGWLLRAPLVSGGFLLFVGSEEPFLGTIFAIDLRKQQVYEQDPPAPGGARRRPQRRRLPQSMVVERLTRSPGVYSRLGSPGGPCAAVTIAGTIVEFSENGQAPASPVLEKVHEKAAPDGKR